MAGNLFLQDLAKLVSKDPDARRSAMNSLKGFIQTQLDDKGLPFFLEQLAAESTKSEASCACAMSLVVEIARVHRHLIVPYIPRIMGTVVRSLPSSAGAHNLLQACASVVSSLARYTIDSSCHGVDGHCEILESLCHPLLGVLGNKVEPMAVGAAVCLQALVESENWKFGSPDLVRDGFHTAAMALGAKGTRTVAHMNLLRTLVKSHPKALQGCGAALLEAAADILLSKRGSWQQRAAAAQLLGALLSVVDQQTLASQLATTSDALERSRLDKVTVVRSAVGEALNIAKSLAPSIHHQLQSNGFHETPSLSPKPRERRNRGRRRSLWSREEASRLTKDGLSGSQEMQLSRRLDESINWIKSAKEFGEEDCAMAAMDASVSVAANDSCHLFMEEELPEPSQAIRARQINNYLQSADYGNGYCQTQIQKSTSDESEAFLTALETGNGREDFADHHVASEFPATPIAGENFALFATPRRMVWSLQSMSSPQDSVCTHEGLERNLETVSESAWSVRDNPMATDSEEGSPKKSSFSDSTSKGDSSLDCAKDNSLSQATGLYSDRCDARSSGLLLEASSRLCMANLDSDDQLKLTGQIHGLSSQDTVDQRMSTQSDTTSYSSSQIAQNSFSEGNGNLLSRWPRDRSVREWARDISIREWAIVDRRLSKIQRYIELLLGGALCAVVIFPMVIAIINCCSRQHNIHTLLPT